MQRAISTHFHVNHRLTTALLDRIWSAGFSKVEIFCGRQHVDYHNKAQVTELGRRAVVLQGDVTRREDCVALVEGTVAALGGIDVW